MLNNLHLQDAKTLQRLSFGQTQNGQPVELYVIMNTTGMVAKIITYGGIVKELHVPDRAGKLNDVVLGFDDLAGYLGPHPYFGAIVGRVASRIARSEFTLDGKRYKLTTNDGFNHLHGGLKGFDKAVWRGEPVQANDGMGVKLSYFSPEGEEGYPGNLWTTVTYTLTERNELRVQYTAKSDKATPVNLTNHSYFNLTDAEKPGVNILGHELTLEANFFTPLDDSLIPTGEIKTVDGTPLDFREAKAIGLRLNELPNRGYDHNIVLNARSGKLALAAKVYEPVSGRCLEVLTTQPCIQLYSSTYLDGSIIGKKGVKYEKHQGLCLETQHFPDSMNQPNFPSTILKPSVTYDQTTVYRFSTK